MEITLRNVSGNFEGVERGTGIHIQIPRAGIDIQKEFTYARWYNQLRPLLIEIATAILDNKAEYIGVNPVMPYPPTTKLPQAPCKVVFVEVTNMRTGDYILFLKAITATLEMFVSALRRQEGVVVETVGWPEDGPNHFTFHSLVGGLAEHNDPVDVIVSITRPGKEKPYRTSTIPRRKAGEPKRKKKRKRRKKKNRGKK